MKKILLATNNEGKIERFKHLLEASNIEVEIHTPKEFGLDKLEINENGSSLAENAEIKARAYYEKVDMIIVSNDTGFYVEGEGLIEAPKRHALAGVREQNLSKEEQAKLITEFWKNVARKHSGKVNAAWQETFVALQPNGEIKIAESRREVILTDQEFGKAHVQMPVRALYISKATNKPAIQHTEKEELLEMQPVIEALKKVLS